jgi:hypothetical protein
MCCNATVHSGDFGIRLWALTGSKHVFSCMFLDASSSAKCTDTDDKLLVKEVLLRPTWIKHCDSLKIPNCILKQRIRLSLTRLLGWRFGPPRLVESSA